jgi:type 1 glutamine amidotransferase
MGYQADIDHSGTYTGILYDERGRGILAQRGHKVSIAADGKRSDETVNSADELLKAIDLDQWNDYEIQALGDHFVLSINGKVTCELTDRETDGFDRSGLLGLQLHAGPPMKVEFKDIRLKRLPLAMNQKKVVFIAGTPSHGWGAHEHNAGCLLMAACLNRAASESGLPVVTTVYKNGWPADPTAIDNADTVVVYCDGGEGHLLHRHGQAFEDIMNRGVGLVCIHYGVEVPKGPTGQRFLQWIGGYFEPDWSVNPHWLARFDEIPDHPITRGVIPFEIQDEWYFHMRFAPEMSRVTPILTAVPPGSTMDRKDGSHSGNPYVREEVKAKKPQHLAWAFVRGDGQGRGFGFTGGHFHKNWQNDDFRKIVLNAIVWTAHVDVPSVGVQSVTPTDEQMDANQDEKKETRSER